MLLETNPINEISSMDIERGISTLTGFLFLAIYSTHVIIEKYNSTGNAIIIDGEIIWYGDINPFKENIYDDSIIRIADEVYAKELILEVKN